MPTGKEQVTSRCRRETCPRRWRGIRYRRLREVQKQVPPGEPPKRVFIEAKGLLKAACVRSRKVSAPTSQVSTASELPRADGRLIGSDREEAKAERCKFKQLLHKSKRGHNHWGRGGEGSKGAVKNSSTLTLNEKGRKRMKRMK